MHDVGDVFHPYFVVMHVLLIVFAICTFILTNVPGSGISCSDNKGMRSEAGMGWLGGEEVCWKKSGYPLFLER